MEKELNEIGIEFVASNKSFIAKGINLPSDSEEKDLTINDINIEEEFNRCVKEIKTIINNSDVTEKALSKKGIRYNTHNESINTYLTPGFIEQVNDLIDIKSKDKYKDNIYPFLAVDPRRENIIDLVKLLVGKDKPFSGIKIYPSLGYLPSHPELMKEGGIYEYCEKNNIPITTHCSEIFITTIKNSINFDGCMCKDIVDGLINVDNYETKNINTIDFVKMDNVYFDYPLGAFSLIPDLNKRSTFYLDPRNWMPVLDKYPTLKLNLAHFGGDIQLKEYIENIDVDNQDKNNMNWTKTIIDLINNPKYPNVYTDVSCFNDEYKLQYINRILNEQVNLRSKIMYGSDYHILMLKENSFSDYIEPFKNKLREEYFDMMSITNPKVFLGIK